jgi:integrase
VTKREQGLSPSTVRTIYTVLRGALDVAVRDGLLRRNPATVVKRPTVEGQDAAYLTADDAHRLLDAIRGDRLEALFRLMLTTGLRREEALALHWVRHRPRRGRPAGAVDPDAHVEGSPARRAEDGEVPPRSAAPPLGRRRTARPPDPPSHGRDAAQEGWRDSDLVFTTEIGTPLEPRNVLRRFELLAQRAGLRGVHLHTLRHSTASFLLAAGTHTKVVQEHLGHSSYAITADIYSHVAPEQKREAADRLDAALDW